MVGDLADRLGEPRVEIADHEGDDDQGNRVGERREELRGHAQGIGDRDPVGLKLRHGGSDDGDGNDGERVEKETVNGGSVGLHGLGLSSCRS